MKRCALRHVIWTWLAAASILCVACGTDVDVGRFADAGADTAPGVDSGADDVAQPGDVARPPPDTGGDGPAGPCVDEQQQLKPGWCLIAGVCYVAQERNPKATCLLCDPSLSTTQWSGIDFDDRQPCFELPCIAQGMGCKSGHCMGPVTLTAPSDEACLLPEGVCYLAGLRSWTGCELCDPARSWTSLSPAAYDCKIGDRCLVAGERRSTSPWEPGGLDCAVCDPAQSKSAWSVEPGFCHIGDRCFAAGDKSPTRCGVCDPAQSQSAWTQAPAGCSIGGQCYEPGEVDPTGCQVCDPARSKTAWSPRPHDCEIDGACLLAGERDGSGCASCDPQKSTSSWTVDAGRCLADGYCAQAGEVAPEGCRICDPSQSTTAWTVTSGCFIDQGCRAAGETHWSGDCAVCDPAKSTTSWTVSAGRCLIGEGTYYGPSCHDAGAAHPSGDCAVCDPQKSQADWTVTSGCLIDGVCVTAGEQGQNGCGICDPLKSQTSWTPATAGKCTISYGTPNYGPPGQPAPTFCYEDGAQHPYSDCAICDTAKNPHAWTVVKGCLILDQCFAPGDQMGCGVCDPAQSSFDWTDIPGCEIPYEGCVPEGKQNDYATCAACDTSQSTTGWSVAGDGCYLNHQCYASGGQLMPGSDCATCDPLKSKTSWTPGPGSCVLSPYNMPSSDRQCYAAGAAHPYGGCAVCAPQKSQTEWTIVSGCLIDGSCYAAGDQCFHAPGGCNPGCWVCDPARSRTSWSPALDRCQLGTDCLPDKEEYLRWDPCAVCDTSTSPPAMKILWGCLIGLQCVQPGQQNYDYNACGVCDPTRSTTAWSPPSGQCLIGGQCFADGESDATGCLVCDASQRPWGWSPAAGATASTYSFDAGTLEGVTLSPAVAGRGWQVSTRRAADGTAALWFGDPLTSSSAGAQRQRATATLPAVTLAAGKPAALSFALWTDTSDPVWALVDETVVWFHRSELGPVPDPNQQTPWQVVIVDLSAYAGQTVVIRFALRTTPAQHPWQAGSEGVYLDAIRVVSGCP